MKEDIGEGAAAVDSAAAANPVLEELVRLVARSEKEGTAMLPEIRTFLDAHPELIPLIGDLAESAKISLVGLAVGGQVVVKEAALRWIAQVEKELAGGPDASPLQRVLARHVAIAELASHEADLSAVNGRSGSLAQIDYLDRRRERAAKRLQAALKIMAIVNKLIQPTLAPIDIACGQRGRTPPSVTRRGMAATQSAGVEN